jgi:hypothetical protein
MLLVQCNDRNESRPVSKQGEEASLKRGQSSVFQALWIGLACLEGWLSGELIVRELYD